MALEMVQTERVQLLRPELTAVQHSGLLLLHFITLFTCSPLKKCMLHPKQMHIYLFIFIVITVIFFWFAREGVSRIPLPPLAAHIAGWVRGWGAGGDVHNYKITKVLIKGVKRRPQCETA